MMKVLKEQGNKQLVAERWSSTTSTIAACRRQADVSRHREYLLFVLDEKGHSVHLTRTGPSSSCPPTSKKLSFARHLAVSASNDHDADDGRQKIEARRGRSGSVRAKAERLNIVNQIE